MVYDDCLLSACLQYQLLFGRIRELVFWLLNDHQLEGILLIDFKERFHIAIGFVWHAVFDVRGYLLVVGYNFIHFERTEQELLGNVTILVTTMTVHTFFSQGRCNSIVRSLVWDQCTTPDTPRSMGHRTGHRTSGWNMWLHPSRKLLDVWAHYPTNSNLF